jgi:hypothetical protein
LAAAIARTLLSASSGEPASAVLGDTIGAPTKPPLPIMGRLPITKNQGRAGRYIHIFMTNDAGDAKIMGNDAGDAKIFSADDTASSGEVI